ncbi:MAG: hypothetical protein GF334_06570 [Candidatus Altiarchaeales archaeon]|nr:hypothetical protein [Candidatus Altiarchaeales archaeon]
MIDEAYENLMEARNIEDYIAILDILSVELPEKYLDPDIINPLLDVLYDFPLPNEFRAVYRHLFEVVLLSALDQAGKLPHPEFAKQVFEEAVPGLFNNLLHIEDNWWDLARRYRRIEGGLRAVQEAGQRHFQRTGAKVFSPFAHWTENL